MKKVKTPTGDQLVNIEQLNGCSEMLSCDVVIIPMDIAGEPAIGLGAEGSNMPASLSRTGVIELVSVLQYWLREGTLYKE